MGRDSQEGGLAACVESALKARQRVFPARRIHLETVALAGQVGGGLSGQLPDSVVEAQTQGEQPAEVEPGEAVVEPGVVLDHAAVGDAPVTAGQPGDAALDQWPFRPVDVLNVWVLGSFPVSPAELFVRAELDAATAC